MYERMRRRQTAKVRLKTKFSIFQNKITTKQKQNHKKITEKSLQFYLYWVFCCVFVLKWITYFRRTVHIKASFFKNHDKIEKNPNLSR